MTDRTRARSLANESIANGDAIGWFERLYREASAGEAVVPWADLVPNPHVVEWLDQEAEHHGRVLDVGCGFGDNAEDLSRRGYEVVAFDVSPTAVEHAKKRFPATKVDYRVGDLLSLPTDFENAFDLVIECYTLQVLPPEPRARAIDSLRRTLRRGGRLLVVARGRAPDDPEGQMPWPLTRAEVEGIATDDVELASIQDFLDDEEPPVRRLRAVFRALG